MGMFNMNATQTVTKAETAFASATATLSAVADTAYQIVGFSGSSSGHAVSVGLEIDDVEVWSQDGCGGSCNSAVIIWGEDGRVTESNQKVEVVTKLVPFTAGYGRANLLYRIVR